MKKLMTLALLTTASAVSAQWSDITNQFYDSLHMPVWAAVQTQTNPIILKSFPDGGYFVIWEDSRNSATTNTDIYAQKYDQAGNRLWAENGVPVVNSPNAQYYVFSSAQDYRTRSFAATDSAGGFYLCYIDDSTNAYNWERIAVQHMRSNGSGVFAGAGFIVEQTPPGEVYTFSMPLLTADGNKGFFISFSKNVYGANYIYVFSYRDENGTMKFYGGGRVNDNAIQKSYSSPCGPQSYLEYPETSVKDYNIWPDGLGSCNVIMSMYANAEGQFKMLGFNKVWRAKKDSRVQTYYRNTLGTSCPKTTEYKNGSLYLLYPTVKDIIVTTCGGGSGPVYKVTTERLLSNGYLLVDQGAYDYYFPKGTTLATTGNISVDFLASGRRTYVNNSISDFTVQGYAYTAEKYDSIPFQRTSFKNPDIGNNPTAPIALDTLAFFRDTLLASGVAIPNFSLAGGGKELYAATVMSTSGDRLVRLQHMSVEKRSTDSFVIQYTAGKFGKVIGKEIITDLNDYIAYDLPIVTANSDGNALFAIREYNHYKRSVRVSPIFYGSVLAWGAMGKSIGTGTYYSNNILNGNYTIDQPVVALDDLNGTGLISWKDSRNIPGNTELNIFMRHLDNLANIHHVPPVTLIKPVLNPTSHITYANPAVLLGTSDVYSAIETYTPYGNNPGTSPVVEILDEYNLGNVEVGVFENSIATRTYNNQPYLDRNYTIKAENHPAGAHINLRLYFTNEEFDSLKAADKSIIDPGDLVVIKQPNNTSIVPAAYIPIAGEQIKTPFEWKAVAGGYYIEIETDGFSNFFIQKSATVVLCPAGNSSITSSLTGTNYQWQVNTGANFSNITNSGNYGGVNTSTLQLNNIPSAWYGYKYRCVVDNFLTSVSSLRFLNTWNGSVNNAWENPANWSCGVVPDDNTDVVISTGIVFVNSNASCRSLTVNPGVSFTVDPGYKLAITH